MIDLAAFFMVVLGVAWIIGGVLLFGMWWGDSENRSFFSVQTMNQGLFSILSMVAILIVACGILSWFGIGMYFVARKGG